MFWRHFGSKFALVLILGTAVLFFFPVAHGSYSAVYGPVTALRSVRTKLRIWLILAMTACSLLFRRSFVAGSRLFGRACLYFGLLFPGLEQVAVLRC
jgi:hypothetical protein